MPADDGKEKWENNEEERKETRNLLRNHIADIDGNIRRIAAAQLSV